MKQIDRCWEKPNGFSAMGILIALVFLCSTANALAQQSPANTSCIFSYRGSAFLAAAHSRGRTVETNCQAADILTNRFHGKQDRNCTVKIKHRSWLSKGWSFHRLDGIGAFTFLMEDYGIKIIIHKKGGFRASRIHTISSADLAIANCNNVGIDDVMK